MFDDGTRQELCCLEGTIPVHYKGMSHMANYKGMSHMAKALENTKIAHVNSVSICQIVCLMKKIIEYLVDVETINVFTASERNSSSWLRPVTTPHLLRVLPLSRHRLPIHTLPSPRRLPAV